VPLDGKKPLFIEGKPFYGLNGNIWEWVKDAWDGSAALLGGTDPVSTSGSFRVIRGGSWGNDAQYLRSDSRYANSPGSRSDGVGFRLVRIRP
jgi:formylglycine-generating enzyme required for sulfatase activity